MHARIIFVLGFIIGAIAASIASAPGANAAASITGAQMPDAKCRGEANRKSSAEASQRVAYYDQCMARRAKGQN